jgi:hypothetical protein
MSIRAITWTFDGITLIASGAAVWFAIQARRSVKRIHEIQNGRRR